MPRPGLIDRIATLRALGVALIFCVLGVALMPGSAFAFQPEGEEAGEEATPAEPAAGEGGEEIDPEEAKKAAALKEKSFLMLSLIHI